MNNSLQNTLKCTKCGENIFTREKNVLTCSNCGNKYMMLNDDIIRTVPNESKKYIFDDININGLHEQLENIPFFLFSENKIKENIEIYRKIVSRNSLRSRIYYSMKTNFNSFILDILSKSGIEYLSAASTIEVRAALSAGFQGENISYDGPVMDRDEIVFALENGIRLFNIDSVEEAVILNELCGQLNIKAQISPRLNFCFGSFLFRMVQVFNERFGFSYNEIMHLIKNISNFKNLEIIGFGFHLGSQITSSGIFVSAFKKILSFSSMLKKKYGISISHINIGGGFPAEETEKNNFVKLGLKTLKLYRGRMFTDKFKFINATLEKIKKSLDEYNRELAVYIQPGRSIIGDAAILVSKIFSIKQNWIFLDASNNYLPETFLTINKKVINISKLGGKSEFKYSIAGRTLCADIFNLNVRLPRPDLDDIVVIESAGAYSLSRHNNFTTLLPPIYLINKNNEIILISNKEKEEDVLKRFK